MFTPEEINAMMERIRNGTASAEDWEALRQALSQPADVLQIPLRQEQINLIIGELKGRDIQIGDRFTTEQILGQKIIYVSVDEIKTREFNQTSPYKGLKKFEPEDKEFFFGRDQFITELANELERTNLLLLLGASGSGKSSVVRAGLLAWLQKEWGSRLVNLTFTPDQDPFESLYSSLLSRGYNQSEARLAKDGKADTLSQVVKTLRQPDTFWFIFIDQFEELFTLTGPEKRDRFITSLVKLGREQAGTPLLRVVATMRADFLNQLDSAPANLLASLTQKNRPMITQMHPDELRQAIEQPAAHHGVVFEKGLVEEIIKDVQGQVGYLPLLQYTLDLLWKAEKDKVGGRTLRTKTYRELGGVRGALQKHVNQIYGKLSESMQLEVKRIFLKLIDIKGDAESETNWQPVRRRALRSKFTGELEERVLTQLIDANLLVSNRQPKAKAATVEIAHESLLTSWTILNNWIREHCQEIALRSQLCKDLERWQESAKEDDLLAGTRLAQAVELRQKLTSKGNSGGLEAKENRFIDVSLGVRDRRRKRTIMGLSAFSTVALMLAGFAGWQWRKAELGQVEALSGSSEVLLASDRKFEALIEGLKAAQRLSGIKGSSIQTVLALLQAVYEVRQHNSLDGHQDSVESVSFSPDGKTIASSSADKTVKLWNLEGKELRTLVGHQDTVNRVSFSPDGKTLATASRDKAVKLWNLEGKELHTFKGHQAPVMDVDFSPDGKTLASASADGTVKL